jgi:coenzyme PQQ precursor peptide PqqA
LRTPSHFVNIGAPDAIASHSARYTTIHTTGALLMTTWIKPEFVDLRLGLEVTLYISNR